MTEKMTFKDTSKAHLKTLRLYVPMVERVHGAHHPEFHEVRKLFDQLDGKIREAGRGRPALEAEFLKLREITGGYQVPGDVCESYEAVYKLLSEMDNAYHA